MKRKYNKTVWVNNKTQINAERLNNIENGIEGLYTDAISLSNLVEGPSIGIEALTGGDIKLSLKLNELQEIPDFTSGELGDYYYIQEESEFYFCLAPGKWIKINNCSIL